jgi:AcrR family transcriptional regulator
MTVEVTSVRSAEVRKRAILEAAARVICAKGFDGASTQEIADACGLTKAGLYHHVESKENLLAEIMSYGMDLFEEQVLSKVIEIENPLERLVECMARNITLVTRGSSKEITVILHEHATLRGDAAKRIDARKKRYVRFLERSFAEAMRQGLIRPVDPTIAAFAFLGMVLWIYKWFRPGGRLTDAQVAEGMIDLLFAGLAREEEPRQPKRTKKEVVR